MNKELPHIHQGTSLSKFIGAVDGITSWLHGDTYTLKLSHADTEVVN